MGRLSPLARLIVVTLALVGGWVLVLTWLEVRTDLAIFLPEDGDRTSALLAQRLKEGPVSGLLLLGISGGDRARLVAASDDLVERLRPSDHFVLAVNGRLPRALPAELSALLPYRYLLTEGSADELTTEGLHRQLEGALARLSSGLGGGADKFLITVDPTGRFQDLQRRWTEGARVGDGPWIATDGHRAILMVRTKASGFDFQAQQQAQDFIAAAFASLPQAQGLRLEMVGPGVFASAARARIAAAANWLTVAAALVVGTICWLALRSLTAVFVVGLPLAGGMLAGAAAVQGLFGFVHGTTLAFGSTLLGVAVDYPIHLALHRRPGEPVRLACRRIWPTLRLGAATTVVAFLSLCGTSFPGLTQLGLFSVAGLIAAAAMTTLVLPLVLPPAKEELVWREWTPWVARSRFLRWPLLAAAALSVAWLVLGPAPWEDDLAQLSPIPAAERALDQALRKELGAPDVRHLLVIEADSAEAVLAANERLMGALDRLVADHAIAGWEGPAKLLPSAGRQEAIRRRLPNSATLQARLAAAIAGTPFRLEAFQRFLDDAETARHLPPLTAERLAGTPIGWRLDLTLSQHEGRWHGLIVPSGVADPHRFAAVADQPGVLYLDLKAESERMMARYRDEALAWLGIGGGMLLLVLTIGLGGLRSALATAGPVALAVLITVGIVAAAGHRLTLFHLAALLLTAGVGLDYALFCRKSFIDSADRTSTWQALLLCSATTVAVFSLLALSSVPVLQALGLTGAVGALLSLICALTFAAPMTEPSLVPAIAALALVSPMGHGLEETTETLLAERCCLTACDLAEAPREAWIGRVAGVEDVLLPEALSAYDCRNNRLAEMGLVAGGFLDAVQAARAVHGARRIGVALGTTTSGIATTEQAMRQRDRVSGALPASFDYHTTQEHYSLAAYVRRRLGLAGPALVVSTACSSSAKVFVIAAEWLAAGLCEAVVVGGVDSLCLTSLRGFASLELLAPEPCRPNDRHRRGISIGEAAGFALLVKEPFAGALRLCGYGESSDAHHMSHPHPEGRGAELAMRMALARAHLPASAIDYVNMHGTGTPANDRIEAHAIAAVFGADTPCSSTKGCSGHTLGAAGIVEAVIACLALRNGFVPGNVGLVEPDPALACAIERHSAPRHLRYALSNSFGFGGNNVSLLFGAGS